MGRRRSFRAEVMAAHLFDYKPGLASDDRVRGDDPRLPEARARVQSPAWGLDDGSWRRSCWAAATSAGCALAVDGHLECEGSGADRADRGHGAAGALALHHSRLAEQRRSRSAARRSSRSATGSRATSTTRSRRASPRS